MGSDIAEGPKARTVNGITQMHVSELIARAVNNDVVDNLESRSIAKLAIFENIASGATGCDRLFHKIRWRQS